MGRRGLVGLFTTHGAKGRGFKPPPRRLFFWRNVSFEECIVSGWPQEEDEEQEQDQEDYRKDTEHLLVNASIKWTKLCISY